MPLPLPPWLDISPATWQSAMSGGASAGAQKGNIANQAVQNRLEQARIDAQSMEASGRNSTAWAEAVLRQQEAERELQQQAEESKASDSLQRDKLAVDVQQQNQAQDAAMQLKQAQMQQDALMQQQDMAFKQAQLEQAGNLGQQRIDTTQDRNQDLDANAQAANDLKASAQGNASTPDDKIKLEQLRGLNHARDVALSKGGVETAAKIDAQIQQLLNPPTPAVQPTPAAYDLTPAPAPSLPSGSQFTLGDPNSPWQFSGGADATTAPTASVPDVQPAAASLRTPSGITTPDVLKAESGSGLPADIEKAMQGRTLQDNTIQPLPKSKDLLETGKVYQTARGPAVWDGQEFIAQ